MVHVIVTNPFRVLIVHKELYYVLQPRGSDFSMTTMTKQQYNELKQRLLSDKERLEAAGVPR